MPKAPAPAPSTGWDSEVSCGEFDAAGFMMILMFSLFIVVPTCANIQDGIRERKKSCAAGRLTISSVESVIRRGDGWWHVESLDPETHVRNLDGDWKLLVIPDVPSGAPHRVETKTAWRDGGCDGTIEFHVHALSEVE